MTPLFFLDDLAVRRLDPDVAGRIVGAVLSGQAELGVGMRHG